MSLETSRTAAKMIRDAGDFNVSAWEDIEDWGIPDGSFVIGLTDDRKRLRVLSDGKAVLHVKGSKKHKQVVIKATENERTVTEKITFQRWFENERSIKPATKNPLAWARRNGLANGRDWRDISRMALPEGTTTTGVITDATLYVSGWDRNTDPSGVTLTVELTHVVPASIQNFLVGQDEKHLFISMLPRECSSVEDAHKALRPPGLKRTALRQGEFFFEPTQRSFKNFHFGAFDLKESVRNREHWWIDQYDINSSTHLVAAMAEADGSLFVRGPVTNERHAPLWLDSWYKVVPNLELEAPDHAENYD